MVNVLRTRKRDLVLRCKPISVDGRIRHALGRRICYNVASECYANNKMTPKDLILEIFRETDFVMESLTNEAAAGDSSAGQVQQSLAAINKACSAFLNGQDFAPHVDKFLRKQMEDDVYEEFEIWGKFSPPPQFIQDSDK